MTLNQEATSTNNNKSEFLQRNGSNDRFTGTYTDNTEATMSPGNHARDLKGSPMAYYSKQVQVKPKVLENNLTSNKDFDGLPENFKKLFTEDKSD